MSFVLPDPFPPPWASEWEEDAEWGLAATLNLNGVKQTFRWIQPGTFLMGSPEGEVDRFGNETLHEVTLSRGYWLADTACTQALWQAVMGENPSFFQDDPAQPVEQVSWEDVQTFLDRLNALVPGLDAGLPSEAQWEYACRAGTTAPFRSAGTSPRAGELQRQLPLRRCGEGLVSGEDRRRQIASSQPLGAVRDARQRLGMVCGLVRPLSRRLADRPGRPSGW
jgi:formylglycine-generating enzyme required for sulfatase activity